MAIDASILLVDDDKNTLSGLETFLGHLGYDVLTAASAESALDLFRKEKPEIILSDIRMPGMDGVQFMEQIKKDDPRCQVILLTAYGTVEDAVKSMKRGAFYYLTKPVNLEELEFLVRKALASRNLEEENKELRKALANERYEKGDMVAESKIMKDIIKMAEQVAQSNATVLIEGESGTGKELIAHRIHELSPRKQQAFVAVHCAALTETLLASELFGHEKGAFTGAIERRLGRFERAHQGTLFLDEIGEISHETQVKLLRVVQEGEFERVGGGKTIKVDVRIICATNKKLIDEVQAGKFREDLYYRLNVINIKLPPLRERKEDIPHLVTAFIRHYALANNKKVTGIDKEALEVIAAYSWPGNIRELRNIIERMIVLSSSEKLSLNQVPEDIRSPQTTPHAVASISSSGSTEGISLAAMEKDAIRQTLVQVRGNKSLAAKKLGISRRTLYRKIDEYQLGGLEAS